MNRNGTTGVKAPWFLDGCVALVTGASRGLGWVIARALCLAGEHVVLNARHDDVLKDRVQELQRLRASGSVTCYDVTSEPDVRAQVNRTNERYGRLDILVNNAGMSSEGPLASTTTSTWRDVLDVDLRACFLHAWEAAPLLAQHDVGRIVNVSSVWGIAGKSELHAYTAAKHGVIGLTRSLAASRVPTSRDRL